MGQKLRPVIAGSRQRSMLRSMKDEPALFDEVVDMSLTSAADFKEKWFHPSKVIKMVIGVKTTNIFQPLLWGSNRNQYRPYLSLSKSEKPCAMVVWLGKGSINGIGVNSENQDARELLVVPNTELVISNTHKEEKLLLFHLPFLPAVEKRVNLLRGLSCVDYVVEGSGVIDHSTARFRKIISSSGRICPKYIENYCLISRSPSEALTMVGLDIDGDFLFRNC